MYLLYTANVRAIWGYIWETTAIYVLSQGYIPTFSLWTLRRPGEVPCGEHDRSLPLRAAGLAATLATPWSSLEHGWEKRKKKNKKHKKTTMKKNNNNNILHHTIILIQQQKSHSSWDVVWCFFFGGVFVYFFLNMASAQPFCQILVQPRSWPCSWRPNLKRLIHREPRFLARCENLSQDASGIFKVYSIWYKGRPTRNIKDMVVTVTGRGSIAKHIPNCEWYLHTEGPAPKILWVSQKVFFHTNPMRYLNPPTDRTRQWIEKLMYHQVSCPQLVVWDTKNPPKCTYIIQVENMRNHHVKFATYA